MAADCSTTEVSMIEEILHRVAADLSMVTDRDLSVKESEVSRDTKRPVGRGQIHISFRMAITGQGETRYGCWLLPLPEAVSLASYLMMVPDEDVRERRELETLDDSTRDAILEVGGFLAGAMDAALRESTGLEVQVSLHGCQGVRRDVRPALDYREGDPLVVGRARAAVHDFPEFDLILMLPELAA